MGGARRKTTLPFRTASSKLILATKGLDRLVRSFSWQPQASNGAFETTLPFRTASSKLILATKWFERAARNDKSVSNGPFETFLGSHMPRTGRSKRHCLFERPVRNVSWRTKGFERAVRSDTVDSNAPFEPFLARCRSGVGFPMGPADHIVQGPRASLEVLGCANSHSGRHISRQTVGRHPPRCDLGRRR